MTLSSANNRNDYTGDDSTSVFSYTFKIFVNSDLVVTEQVIATGAETTLTITTDYTVTGAGDSNGGTITLVAGALASTKKLVIRRVRPLTQDTDIRNQGSFFPETYEDALDHQMMVSQQNDETLGRSIQVGITTDPSFNATLPVPVAGEGIRVNDAGTAYEGAPFADAAAQAAAAAASAAAASTSETNAATSETNAASSATAAAASATAAAASAATVNLEQTTANIAYNSLLIATNNALSTLNLSEGVVDTYTDADGLASTSTDAHVNDGNLTNSFLTTINTGKRDLPRNGKLYIKAPSFAQPFFYDAYGKHNFTTVSDGTSLKVAGGSGIAMWDHGYIAVNNRSATNTNHFSLPIHPDFSWWEHENWEYSCWFRFVSPVQTEIGFFVISEGSDYFSITTDDVTGNQITVRTVGGVGTFSTTTTGDALIGERWYHLLVAKVDKDLGVYIDGDQRAYQDLTAIPETFYLAADDIRIFDHPDETNTHGLNGSLQDIFIGTGNEYNVTPNSGNTDSFTFRTGPWDRASDDDVILYVDCEGADAGTKLQNVDSGPLFAYTSHNGAETVEFDTAQKKFGSSSLLQTGAASTTGMDVISNGIILSPQYWTDYTFSFWVRFQDVTTPARQVFFGYGTTDANNRFFFDYEDSTGFARCVWSVNSTDYTMTSADLSLANDTWYLFTLCKSGNNVGLYVGSGASVSQVAYKDVTGINQRYFNSPNSPQTRFLIDPENATLYLKGWMDDIFITKTNHFGAAPVVGLTDTITAPTAAFGSPAATVAISDTFTAQSAPDQAHVNLRIDTTDGNPTLNTDIIVDVSRDGGTTWTTATLVKTGEEPGNNVDLVGDAVDISAQPAGTSMKYRVTTTTTAIVDVEGIGFIWG